MAFSSITFLFYYLPVFLLVYYLARHRFRFIVLFFSSLLFYFWGENFLIWILLTCIIIDFLAGLLIADGFNNKQIKKIEIGKPHTRGQKLGLTFSIGSNLIMLGYFKYAGFFVENVIAFFHRFGMEAIFPVSTLNIALPLGISFYTFQSMSYTIDVYRGNTVATRDFLKFATYITMFPQLVAGPIVRYSEIEWQFSEHKIRFDEVIKGVQRLIVGLAKKVIIANKMALIADAIFVIPTNELSAGQAWLGVLGYGFQIYYDFSGYSDMAIGLGLMLGFRYPENFNYPYISSSMREFWRRWHISLSSWFRDYLYVALGGNRRGTFITYFNLLIVFFVVGLWHGASWNFVVWGLFHGTFLIIERFPFIQKFTTLPAIFKHIYVLFVVSIGWVFFRTETLSDAFHYIQVLTVIHSPATQWFALQELLQNDALLILILAFMFSTPVIKLLQVKLNTFSTGFRNIAYLFYIILLLMIFLFCSMTLASGTYNPFIYFRF